MIKIEETDVTYLLGIYSDRLQDKNPKHKGKSIVDISNINASSKIYVFPNCRIKKLPLRKWIKDVGATQVFKAEEANCLIIKQGITTNRYDNARSPFEIIKWWTVPAGEYFSERKNEVAYTFVQDQMYRDPQMVSFMFQTYYARDEYDHMMSHEEKAIKKRLTNHWEADYQVKCNHSQIEENELNALKDRSMTLINEIDLQQVVYDWEVKEDVRDDLAVYDWDNLYRLLCGETTWNLGIMMIKKGNVESMLSKLVACFYDTSIAAETRIAMYDKIFVRKPDLRACIDRRDAYNSRSWHLRDNVEYLFKNIKKSGQELDLQPFEDILNIRVADKGDKYYVEQLPS